MIRYPAHSADRRLLVYVGSIGPLGFLPASGTATVLLIGLPVFWVASTWPLVAYIPLAALFTLASVWIHHRGDAILGEKDSRKLVWDELAGFWIAVIAVPFTWKTALAAFLIERTLDIVKAPPARWIESRWPGGWGVVGDDLVAGLYTLAVLHLLIGFLPGAML